MWSELQHTSTLQSNVDRMDSWEWRHRGPSTHWYQSTEHLRENIRTHTYDTFHFQEKDFCLQ